MQHVLEALPASTGLKVGCRRLILELCQLERAVLTYRIEVAKGSVRVQTHHTLRMSLQQLVLYGGF